MIKAMVENLAQHKIANQKATHQKTTINKKIST